MMRKEKKKKKGKRIDRGKSARKLPDNGTTPTTPTTEEKN